MKFRAKNWYKRYFGNPAKKRNAWHSHLERQALAHGIQIYKPHLNWQLPGVFQDAVANWGDLPGIPLDRCNVLFAAGQYIRGASIPGPTADCGVRYGRSSHYILKGLDDGTRSHYLFDSFAGLSAPSLVDVPDTKLVGKWQPGDLAVAEDKVRQQLAAFENCRYMKGWIPERFDEIAEQRFALVHIDVDLHEPTRDCFVFFYPRVAPGGLLICDDYGSSGCPGATRAVDEFFADKPEAPLALPTGQALIYKR